MKRKLRGENFFNRFCFYYTSTKTIFKKFSRFLKYPIEIRYTVPKPNENKVIPLVILYRGINSLVFFFLNSIFIEGIFYIQYIHKQ